MSIESSGTAWAGSPKASRRDATAFHAAPALTPHGWRLLLRRGAMATTVALQIPQGLATARGQRLTDSPGVNLVSFPPRLHQSAASVVKTLDAAVRTAAIPNAWFSSAHDGAVGLRDDPREVYRSTIAHVQPGNLPLMAARSPQLLRRSNFTACVAYWETDRIKKVHTTGVPWLDEIWTLSEFCRVPFNALTNKPVRVLPFPVPAPTATSGEWRKHMGLSDEFVFSFQFDMASTTQRKNPDGLVESYRRAFPRPRADTVLVIKTMNSSWFPEEFRQLQRSVKGREDVKLVDEFWPEAVNSAYYGDIDCYVSLHRAEGFGIGMARAMAAGTAVLATGYSGNLDFMDEKNSVLVPARVVPTGKQPVYPRNSRWAQPDLDFAADAMRSIRTDEHLRTTLGQQAARDLAPRTSAALGSWIRQHIPGLS